ncbi:MAG: ABC transporter ATP-binding protein [Spirochaetaceae bacterium]|nr:ABC transporter ATP-binding protein [Spirochaetaceae bacterium]
MSKNARNRRLTGYLADFKGLFFAGFAALSLVTAGQLVGPLILRGIIDESIPKRDVAGMLYRALAYLGVVVGMGGLTYYGTIVIARLGLEVVTRIKKDLFAHFLTLPVSYFDKHPVGELMARVESDTEKVKELFSRIGVTLATNVLFFAGMLAVCFALEPRITAYIAGTIPFALAFVIYFFDKLRVLFDKSRAAYAAVVARVTEYVQGVEVLKAFGRTRWAVDSLAEKSKEKRDAEIKAEVLEYSAMGGLGFAIGPLFMAAIVKVLAPEILAGAMTLGTLLVFLEYGRRLFDPLMAIAENVRGIQHARVSLKRIFDIMSIPPEEGRRFSCPDGTSVDGRRSAAEPLFEREIEFRHVWFRYKEEEWVLEDVSFVIKRGQSLALVGPSGSGKTTTVSLLCRFYEPTRGEILVDGRPLKELDLDCWRRKIGLVLQDVYLFPGPVLENVRVYDESVGEEDVRAALAAVRATDFVERLPDGLRSEIRERGSNISAGEKQLLSFARALAFGPEIVVLDEATASIDVQTERRIAEGMKGLLAGRTSVIVAHRLSSIAGADAILFFKEGRIAARGRNGELLEGFPEYAELVRLQFPDRQAESQPSGAPPTEARAAGERAAGERADGSAASQRARQPAASAEGGAA